MALLTQKAILSTFQEMLYETPLDKISVSALVKRCGISSNTFYYHYHDIYELLEVWLNKCVDEIRGKTNCTEDWKQETKAVFIACRENEQIIRHIITSLSREQLEHYVFTQTEDVFVKNVEKRTSEKNLTKDQVREIAMFCRYSYIGMFLNANWNHFQGDIDSMVDHMGMLFDIFVDSAAERFIRASVEK